MANDGNGGLNKAATVLTFGSLLPLGLAWVGGQFLDHGLHWDWDVWYPKWYDALFFGVLHLSALGVLAGTIGAALMSVQEVKGNRRKRALNNP